MALVTGTPLGTITSQESLYVYNAPSIYFQDATATPLSNPDADGFYWGLSGTATYPVFEVGCPNGVSFTENLTTNDVLCDNVGVSNVIMARNSIDVVFQIQTMFPLSVIRHMLKGGTVSKNTGTKTEKFGFGQPNNNLFFHVYTPKVYDETNGDYVWMYFDRARFVDAWTINANFGQNWSIQGLKLRAFANTARPAAQYFGMMGRCDADVLNV